MNLSKFGCFVDPESIKPLIGRPFMIAESPTQDPILWANKYCFSKGYFLFVSFIRFTKSFVIISQPSDSANLPFL